MGPSPYFIGNPGEIKDNRGSDKIPRRQSVAEDCSTLRHCTHYTVQYSTEQCPGRGERRAEEGARAGSEWHSLSDSTGGG